MSILATANDAHRFTLAGRAHVTLESTVTGRHFTYRIDRATDRATKRPTEPAAWFVSLLTDGSADEGSFRYVGLIGTDESFRLTRKSAYDDTACCTKAFRYYWTHVQAGSLPDKLKVRHEGRCGRCGRTLTTPESIDRGIGPECAEKMGLVCS